NHTLPKKRHRRINHALTHHTHLPYPAKRHNSAAFATDNGVPLTWPSSLSSRSSCGEILKYPTESMARDSTVPLPLRKDKAMHRKCAANVQQKADACQSARNLIPPEDTFVASRIPEKIPETIVEVWSRNNVIYDARRSAGTSC